MAPSFRLWLWRWMRFWRCRTRRARLASVIAEMEYHEDVHVTLISRQAANDLRVWSEPVQVMVEPGRDGLVELTVRRYEGRPV